MNGKMNTNGWKDGRTKTNEWTDLSKNDKAYCDSTQKLFAKSSH